jgi:hypothetical protein
MSRCGLNETATLIKAYHQFDSGPQALLFGPSSPSSCSRLITVLKGKSCPLGLKSAQAVAILPGCLCFHENTNKKIAIKVLTLFSFSYLLIRPFNTSRC